MKRTLILGSMPEGATPQTHIAAGPWCFAGREALFPDWWRAAMPHGDKDTDCVGMDGVFPLPVDPYPDAAAMEAAGKAANGEVLRLLPILGKELGFGTNPAFLEMALGPWLLLCVHMLAERQKRAEDLIARYGDEALCVPILPAREFPPFRSSHDFMIRGVQDVIFNHAVFSRMMEAMAPTNWELVMLPEDHTPSAPKRTGSASLKKDLGDALRALPFPRQKGFSLGQSLYLSLAVLLNRGATPDATLDFSRYCARPLAWRFPAESLIRACLPMELRGAPIPSPPRRKGRLRGMTAVFSQDDRYRLALAAWLAGGGRLFCVQHGANYGNLLATGGIPTEYRQHAFFSWGWERHGDLPVNAHPLPHPSLAALAGRHQENNSSLILVGTEMSTLAYRLKSRPQAAQLVRYREDKVRFLRSLGPELLPHAAYRPYFAVAGGLEDASYVQRRMAGHAGETTISLCDGNLTDAMLGCRLLVLDHYGTTLHMALVADIPVLCFWRREEWGMDAATEQALDLLAEAGMLFSSPEDAAAQAHHIWTDAASWWRSEPVRAARQYWLDHYALCCVDAAGRARPMRDIMRQWFAALKTV